VTYGQSPTGTAGVESDQLLTQSEVLKDEVLMGSKNTNQPAYKVPKQHNHARNLTR
jgi:hypothetical protein